MGAESSKTELKNELKDISNQINQELSDFFGNIEGFQWSSGGKVDSLEKYAKGNLNLVPSRETIKSIKEERQVCQSIILPYKDRLNGLLKDSKFREKLDSFVKQKGLKSNKITIRDRKFSQSNDEICDEVIKYYYLKYRLYRLLKNFDPYQAEYEYIIKSIDKIKKSQKKKLTNEDEINQRILELQSARKDYQDFVLKYLKKLNNDPKYSEMESLWYELTKNNTRLAGYCNKISNSCENISNYAFLKNPENFKLTDSSKNKQCGQINLENYKQLSLCRGGNVKKEEKKKKDDDDDFFGGLAKRKRGLGGGLGAFRRNRLRGLNLEKPEWD